MAQRHFWFSCNSLHYIADILQRHIKCTKSQYIEFLIRNAHTHTHIRKSTYLPIYNNNIYICFRRIISIHIAIEYHIISYRIIAFIFYFDIICVGFFIAVTPKKKCYILQILIKYSYLLII